MELLIGREIIKIQIVTHLSSKRCCNLKSLRSCVVVSAL